MYPAIADSILETIGHTPMLRVQRLFAPHQQGHSLEVLGKLEYFNPGGSVKDRVALTMIEQAEARGQLKPGATLVEGTSGNTGFGLALVAASKGYKCVFTMKDSISREKVAMLKALGAEVVLCPAKAAPESPESYFSVAARLAREIPGALHLNQYDNPDNPLAHYQSLGPEIWEQTQGRITHYVAAMGTTGTLVGAARYLKAQNPAVQVLGVDVHGSILKGLFETGRVDERTKGPYLTEAVGRSHAPGVFDPACIDAVVQVSDLDGVAMARRAAREESLFLGWSSGTALAGLNHWLSLNPVSQPMCVVVLLPDHGSRYLGKIYDDAWLEAQGLSLDPEPQPAGQQRADDLALAFPALHGLFSA